MTDFQSDILPRENRACLHCGMGFYVQRRRPGRGKYCSRSCNAKARRAREALPLESRFWSKVARGGKDECWPWQGTKHGKGYGHIRVGSKVEKAHRVAYRLECGPIPDSMMVLHRCDNPTCCNPDHLFLGTNDDNLEDRQAKGRQAVASRNARSKLTAAQAREIKRRLRAGDRPAKIARDFPVQEPAIRLIREGKTWKHV